MTTNVAPKNTKAVPPAKFSQNMEVNMIAPDALKGEFPGCLTSSVFLTIYEKIVRPEIKTAEEIPM
jgi:hypothetical protein